MKNIDTILNKFNKSEHSWLRNYYFKQSRRIENDIQYIINLPNIKSILNIGAAPFLFEYLIKDRISNIQLYSIDHDPERFKKIIDYVNTNVIKFDIEKDSINSLPIEFHNVDIIVFTEVFEHMRIDLLNTVQKLYDLLPSGGLLYLTTPNGLSIRSVFRLMCGRTGPNPVTQWNKLREVGHMGHVREYSRKEVNAILSGAGFKIEHSALRKHWNSILDKSFLFAIFRVVENIFPLFRWNIQILAKKV